jgi:hypothetical protein
MYCLLLIYTWCDWLQWMEDKETPRMRKYGESKTTRIMMATVPHVTAWAGRTKYRADGFLFDWVYSASLVGKHCSKSYDRSYLSCWSVAREQLQGKSDVWLTVHRNSVWIRNKLDVTFCILYFSSNLNMFRATMCPSSGADDCVML